MFYLRYVATVLLVLLIVAVALFVVVSCITNPDKDDFLEWYKASVLPDENEDNVVMDAINGFIEKGVLEYVAENTEVERHLVYTIFTTKFNGVENRYSGFFNSFVELK